MTTKDKIEKFGNWFPAVLNCPTGRGCLRQLTYNEIQMIKNIDIAEDLSIQSYLGIIEPCEVRRKLVSAAYFPVMENNTVMVKARCLEKDCKFNTDKLTNKS